VLPPALIDRTNALSADELAPPSPLILAAEQFMAEHPEILHRLSH
jgi:hypothetical protein